MKILSYEILEILLSKNNDLNNFCEAISTRRNAKLDKLFEAINILRLYFP